MYKPINRSALQFRKTLPFITPKEKCAVSQIEASIFWSTWGAQSVEQLTHDFSSGHDPWVLGSSPASGPMLSVEPAWDSPSLPLSLPCSCSLTLSLSLKRKEKKRRGEERRGEERRGEERKEEKRREEKRREEKRKKEKFLLSQPSPKS